MLIFYISLFSKDITIHLKNRYCINDRVLTLKDVYKNSKQNDIIYKIPKNITNYKIPSAKIIYILEKYKYFHIKDDSNGIVTLDTQCFIDFKKDMIIRDIKKAYTKAFPNINIKSINIRTSSHFPINFQNYSYEGIRLPKYFFNLHNFTAIYKSDRNKRIQIFFKYDIDAKIELFKAKNNITNGKIISLKNVEKKEVDLKDTPFNFIKEIEDGKFVAKNYIKKGTILTQYMIKKIKLIEKNSEVRAVIKDGGVEISFFGTALNSADLNEPIKIRGENGKMYSAVVVGKNLVKVK